MSSDVSVPKRKLPVLRLVVAGVVCAVVGLVVLREIGWARLMEWVDLFIAAIRDMGPWVFFGVMAVLPAFGAPLSIFSLAAGEAFAPRFTMPGVIALAMVAIAVNQALSYWLARYALRPVLGKLVARYGYQVPRVTKENALGLAIIVRNTPGPPYFMQSYLLGLGEVPFGLYMIVSWLSVLPWTAAFIMLGKAAREGHFGKIATGIGVLVIAVAAVQILRKKFAKRES